MDKQQKEFIQEAIKHVEYNKTVRIITWVSLGGEFPKFSNQNEAKNYFKNKAFLEVPGSRTNPYA